MMKNINISILIILYICVGIVFAQANNTTTEVLPNLDNNPTNTAVLNDQIRQLQSGIQAISGGIDINNGTTGILQPSKGGTGQDSSNWPVGDYVYLSSLGTWGHTPPLVSQVFTASGTFTVPAGISVIFLTECGGGGAGGGFNSANNFGGGGGGGAACVKDYPIAVSGTVTVTIGAGGTGGVGTGGNGGTTSFGSIVALGGNGGQVGQVSAGGAGGAGGSAIASPANAVATGAGAAIYIPTFAGGNGGGGSGTNFVAAGGGGTILAAGANAEVAGTANAGNGGGGSAIGSGLLGGSGVVIIQY